MKNFLILISILLLTACTGGGFSSSNSGNNSSNDETSSAVSEDTYAARQQGYNEGFETGHFAGYNDYFNGANYDDSNNYSTTEGRNAYKSGYEDGYADGFRKGIADRKADIMKDPHKWESEDVDGLYVYLDGVDDDDVADYYAREYSDGEYIREGWKYFAKVSQTWGEYEVTLGERVASNLYKIRGSDIYIHFKWGLPDVSSGDEGVLDLSGTFSTFYIKPNY